MADDPSGRIQLTAPTPSRCPHPLTLHGRSKQLQVYENGSFEFFPAHTLYRGQILPSVVIKTVTPTLNLQSSGGVWKSGGRPWLPVPEIPTVSVGVKQQWTWTFNLLNLNLQPQQPGGGTALPLLIPGQSLWSSFGGPLLTMAVSEPRSTSKTRFCAPFLQTLQQLITPLKGNSLSSHINFVYRNRP